MPWCFAWFFFFWSGLMIRLIRNVHLLVFPPATAKVFCWPGAACEVFLGASAGACWTRGF